MEVQNLKIQCPHARNETELKLFKMSDLTPGKLYDVESKSKGLYWIRDDVDFTICVDLSTKHTREYSSDFNIRNRWKLYKPSRVKSFFTRLKKFFKS